MQFNSLQFLIFFPIVLLLYYVLPVLFFNRGYIGFRLDLFVSFFPQLGSFVKAVPADRLGIIQWTGYAGG